MYTPVKVTVETIHSLTTTTFTTITQSLTEEEVVLHDIKHQLRELLAESKAVLVNGSDQTDGG